MFQTHFVCVVPPYRTPSITEPVPVRLCVVSSGKTSEYHQFVYTPVNGTVSGKHIKCIIATSFPEDGLISGFDRFSSPKFDLRPIGTRRCDMLFIGSNRHNRTQYAEVSGQGLWCEKIACNLLLILFEQSR